MQEKIVHIHNEKLVTRAAQSVWAANKYLTLGSSQRAYRDIRQLFRPDIGELDTAFTVLKKTDETYDCVPSEALPELSNALYHIAGYFKKQLSTEKRQEVNMLIKASPAQALAQLDKLATHYDIAYLTQSRLWPRNRTIAFNKVPVSLTFEGHTYAPFQLAWEGSKLTLHL